MPQDADGESPQETRVAPDPRAERAGHEAADDSWPIVGVGASAGGLEALQALVKDLTCRNTGLIVTQHLSPTHESLLTEILARSTALEVITATEGMVVQKGRVHVLPGGADLAIEGGRLRLSPTQGLGARLPIDAFLRSLASDRGAQAVGVVLSGGGIDGTAGLRAIQAHGGLTYAQEPESSAHPSMPRSAIEAGVADFVLTPAAIAAELMRIDAGADPDRSPSDADPQVVRALFAALRIAFGIDFTEYKPVTIHRRIERRMMLAGIDDLASYERRTRDDPDELGALYRDLLIHVTGFFREPEVFEALRNVVFPRLAARAGPAAPVRIWVAGCSTGEEAYSIGMSLLEHLDGREPRPDARIFATDLDEEAIGAGRIGSYPRDIEKSVSADRLQRFFTRLGAGYRVSYALRDMVVFATHDLTRDPPFSHVDVVSCRNVLIYMQPALQRRLLTMFHGALRPDGFLVLGSSEGLGAASDLFVPVAGRERVFAKKAVAVSKAMEHTGRSPSTWRASRPPRSAARISELVARTEQHVLERYGPPGILVTSHREVVHCRGRMGPFLAPASTPPTVDALRLVRSELVAELSTVLSQTLEAGTPALSRPLSLTGIEGVQSVVLETIPIADDEGGRCALVLFREQAPAAAWEPHEVGEAAARVQELEQTLGATRDYLQRRVQQADAAGQVRSAESEALHAANEELQSSNEELESSREELQSTNEELATVNAELQSSLTELGQSNDDLLNLLVAFDVPIVIISMDLRIRRFTSAAARLFDLIAADVGRSVTHLKSFVDLTDIERIAGEVIRTGAPQQRDVQDSERRWFVMRVLPYRASDDTVRGAVLELVRASPMRKPGRAGEIHDYAAQILSSLPGPLALLDEGMTVVWANDAFASSFGDARALAGSLKTLWQDVPAETWDRIAAVLSGGPSFDGLEARIASSSRAAQRVLLSLRRAPPDSRRWVLLAVHPAIANESALAGGDAV